MQVLVSPDASCVVYVYHEMVQRFAQRMLNVSLVIPRRRPDLDGDIRGIPSRSRCSQMGPAYAPTHDDALQRAAL